MTRATWLLLIGCLLLQVHCALRKSLKSRKGDPFDKLPDNFWLDFSSPFTESYDEEWTELEVTPTPEPLPFFEDATNSTNISTQLGSSVFLHCRVNDLRDKTFPMTVAEWNSEFVISFGIRWAHWMGNI